MAQAIICLTVDMCFRCILTRGPEDHCGLSQEADTNGIYFLV